MQMAYFQTKVDHIMVIHYPSTTFLYKILYSVV